MRCRRALAQFCSCFVRHSALCSSPCYAKLQFAVARRNRIPLPTLPRKQGRVGRGIRRGALTNASGRFEPQVAVAFDDGWQSIEDLPPFKTEVAIDTARKVITRNASPDIPFDRSIN